MPGPLQPSRLAPALASALGHLRNVAMTRAQVSAPGAAGALIRRLTGGSSSRSGDAPRTGVDGRSVSGIAAAGAAAGVPEPVAPRTRPTRTSGIAAASYAAAMEAPRGASAP